MGDKDHRTERLFSALKAKWDMNTNTFTIIIRHYVSSVHLNLLEIARRISAETKWNYLP